MYTRIVELNFGKDYTIIFKNLNQLSLLSLSVYLSRHSKNQRWPLPAKVCRRVSSRTLDFSKRRGEFSAWAAVSSLRTRNLERLICSSSSWSSTGPALCKWGGSWGGVWAGIMRDGGYVSSLAPHKLSGAEEGLRLGACPNVLTLTLLRRIACLAPSSRAENTRPRASFYFFAAPFRRIRVDTMCGWAHTGRGPDLCRRYPRSLSFGSIKSAANRKRNGNGIWLE